MPPRLRTTPLRSFKFTGPTSFCPSFAIQSARLLSTTLPRKHVDPTELSHFADLASTWWHPHGPSRLLHLMNPLRLEFISTLRPLSATSKGRHLRYLDVGCGGGILAESLARLPGTKTVVGLEPAVEVYNVAVAHRRQDPGLRGVLHYWNCSLEEYAPSAMAAEKAAPDAEGLVKEFDYITLMEVLEHAPRPFDLLDTALTLLRPGGYLAMSTISRTALSYLTTKLVAEDLLRIVPRGTHDWNKYITPEEMARWVRSRKDLEGLVVRGAAYVPGCGWKWVGEARGERGWDGWGGGELGNYFVAVRKKA